VKRSETISGALPTRLIGEMTLWLAPETQVRWAGVNGRNIREVSLDERFTGEWGTVPHTWRGTGVVIHARPGRAHSIWHFFDDGGFRGWYVNLEAPWRRTPIGWDTDDHELDIWVEPDGSWQWKDTDDLAAAVKLGFYTREHADAIRTEGDRVIAEQPWPTGWEDWRPNPAWAPPELPEDWDVV
jgi:Protein of unknown function (DUF402)